MLFSKDNSKSVKSIVYPFLAFSNGNAGKSHKSREWLLSKQVNNNNNNLGNPGNSCKYGTVPRGH